MPKVGEIYPVADGRAVHVEAVNAEAIQCRYVSASGRLGDEVEFTAQGLQACAQAARSRNPPVRLGEVCA